MIKINKWNETFENSDSRKRQRLKFYYAPSGNDSNGYIELMSVHGERGVLALGVFTAICQYTATQSADRRGVLGRASGEALNIVQLSSILRMPENTVKDALELLSLPEIGWISAIDWQIVKRSKSAISERKESGEKKQSASILPIATVESAGNLPALCKDKDKDKEREGLSCTNTREAENLNCRVSRVVPKIKALLPAWSKLVIRETSYEWREIGAQVDHWENYDFDLVRSYFASDADDGFKQTKLRTFLEDWGAGMLGKAHEWKKPKAKAREQAKAKTEKPTRELWQVQKEIASAEAELTAIIQNLRNWHHVPNPNPGPGKAATIKVLKSGPELDRIRLENYISKLKQEKAILTQ